MLEHVAECIRRQEIRNTQIQGFDYSVVGAPLFVIRDILKSPDAGKQEIWRSDEDTLSEELARIKRERLAMAAIKAMSEPTPEMLEYSGTMTGFDSDRDDADQCHVDWWKLMLSAALSETRPEAEKGEP